MSARPSSSSSVEPGASRLVRSRSSGGRESVFVLELGDSWLGAWMREGEWVYVSMLQSGAWMRKGECGYVSMLQFGGMEL